MATKVRVEKAKPLRRLLEGRLSANELKEIKNGKVILLPRLSGSDWHQVRHYVNHNL